MKISRWWFIRSVLFLASLAIGAISAAPAHAQTFVHPGGLHTRADLDRMKARVAAGQSPWIESWNALLTNSKAQSNYNPAPNPNMGASRQRASADAVAAYFNALRGYIADSPAHTDNAIRICNLWSAAVNQIPSGGDQPGLSGLYAYQFAVVGELLRIHVGTRWAPEDFERFRSMVRHYLYPIVHDFLVRHNNACITHYWANWDAANIVALAAIGVLLDDHAIFNEGLEYFMNGAGNGSIKNAVYALHPGGPGQPYGLGQWQEMGRDQEHNILGVGLLATFCQVAWNQGVDMFSYDNNRLLAGAEYVAQYAIGQDVPYAFFDNCDDVNQYWPASHDRGRLQRPIWELLYNHYVVRQGLSAPSLSALAALNRPEGFSHDDHFGYGTLAFTLDPAVSGYPVAAPAAPAGLAASDGVARVYLSWNPVPTANGYVVRRATTAGGPYTEIANYRGAINRYTDTTAANGTTYFYRVAASNQAGTGSDSLEVKATPVADSPALPEGWTRRDIGDVSLAGSASFATAAGGTFFVQGSGARIGGNADGLSFAFASVQGDVSITARRFGFSGSGGNSARIGIMIRESLAPNAKTQTLFVGDLGWREARFGTRATTGGTMSFITGNGYSSNAWFRLLRRGNVFSAYQSGDGIDWFLVGSTTVSMPEVVQVGIAVSSSGANLIRGDFDNVALEGMVLPAPPANLTAVNGHGQVRLTWTASSGLSTYEVKRATTSGGPYTVVATGLTGTSYVDTGLTDGTNYYYVVTGRAGTYETVSSNEALGTPGDISFIWNTSPGSGQWSVGTNWMGGEVPENGASIAFGASNVTTLVNDLSHLAIARLTFNSGAPAYTIEGQALAVSGDIANHSTAAQTVTLGLALGSSITVEPRSGSIALRGVVSDGGAGHGLLKTGSQPLFLSGANTFAGDFRSTGGTVSIAGVGTGTAGAPLTGAVGRGTVRLAGGTLTSSAAATIYNNIVVEAGTTVGISSATANLTLAGNISGGGNINESGANVGATVLLGDNSGFTGTFTSSNATNHRLRFNQPTAGSAAATWVLNNSQTDGTSFGFPNGTATIEFGALSGSGQFRNNAVGTTTVRIGALNTNTTFSGFFVSNTNRIIAVEKVGTGRLTFTGSHTYDGPTAVNGGTLIVNRSLRNAVTVNSGATFGGTGTVTAAINVNSGGAFAPGDGGIGIFTTSAALTLGSGATYRVELNSASAQADRVVASAVHLTGANLAVTDLGDAGLTAGATFTIIDNTGAAAITGTFAGKPEGAMFDVGANRFRISYVGGNGNDVVLTTIVPAVVSLANLQQTYDGGPRPVTVTTSPAGVAVAVTYDGSATAPTAAGSYAVAAAVTDPHYTGAATGTLVIAKANAAVTLASLQHTYDGSPKAATAVTIPAGLPVSITYNGQSDAPSAAGSYAVAAIVADPNYTGAASGTLAISKASAQITLAPLVQPYTGTPREVLASTVPEDLTVTLTYNGVSAAPVYPGDYTIVATIDNDNYAGSTSDTLTVTIPALVRRAPAIAGILDGSIQVLAAENLTLKETATLSGDLLVRGKPSVIIKGDPTRVAIRTAPGAAAPTSHTVTINDGAVLRYLVLQVDEIGLPGVSAPPAPTGNRSVTLSKAGQNPGNWASVRNLTLNGGAGKVAVPAGAYGDFLANGETGFVLGDAANATNGSPLLYHFQNLTLNGASTLEVVGPVVITLANGTVINARVGTGAHPEWLTLQVRSGGVTLNTGATLNGHVIAPSGTVTINSGATVHGSIAAEGLTINSGGLLGDVEH
jgi:autotransporter-associated beta strand protein